MMDIEIRKLGDLNYDDYVSLIMDAINDTTGDMKDGDAGEQTS